MTTQTGPRQGGFSYGQPRPVRGSNFELWSWLYMRISGVLLVVLALGHLYMVHVITRVEDVNYQFVVERWATPFFRTWDMLLLLLAMLHGINGTRVIIDDYLTHRPGWRVAALSVLYALGFILLVLGALIIITFQPIGLD